MNDDAYEFFSYIQDIHLVPGPCDPERYRDLARRKWWLCGADPAKFEDWWRNYFRSGGMWGRYTFTAKDYSYFDRFTRGRYFSGRTPRPYQAVAVKMGGQIYIPLTQVKNKYQSAAFNLSIDTPIAIAVPPGEDPQGQVDEWAKERKSTLSSLATPVTDEFMVFSKIISVNVEFARYWWPKGPHDYKNMSEHNKGMDGHNGKYYEHPSMYDAYGNFAYGATGAACGYSLSILDEAARPFTSASNPINWQDIQSGFDAVSNGGKLVVFEYNPVRYRDQLSRYRIGGKLVINRDDLSLPIGLQAARYINR